MINDRKIERRLQNRYNFIQILIGRAWNKYKTEQSWFYKLNRVQAVLEWMLLSEKVLDWEVKKLLRLIELLDDLADSLHADEADETDMKPVIKWMETNLPEVWQSTESLHPFVNNGCGLCEYRLRDKYNVDSRGRAYARQVEGKNVDTRTTKIAQDMMLLAEYYKTHPEDLEKAKKEFGPNIQEVFDFFNNREEIKLTLHVIDRGNNPKKGYPKYYELTYGENKTIGPQNFNLAMYIAIAICNQQGRGFVFPREKELLNKVYNIICNQNPQIKAITSADITKAGSQFNRVLIDTLGVRDSHALLIVSNEQGYFINNPALIDYSCMANLI